MVLLAIVLFFSFPSFFVLFAFLCYIDVSFVSSPCTLPSSLCFINPFFFSLLALFAVSPRLSVVSPYSCHLLSVSLFIFLEVLTVVVGLFLMSSSVALWAHIVSWFLFFLYSSFYSSHSYRQFCSFFLCCFSLNLSIKMLHIKWYLF